MGEAEERRHERAASVAALSDTALQAEVRRAVTARWSRPSRLESHAKQHGAAIGAFFGESGPQLSDRGYDAARTAVGASPDRVFTGSTHRGEIEYHFVRMGPHDSAIIVSVRGDHVRTMFVVRSLHAGWPGRAN